MKSSHSFGTATEVLAARATTPVSNFAPACTVCVHLVSCTYMSQPPDSTMTYFGFTLCFWTWTFVSIFLFSPHQCKLDSFQNNAYFLLSDSNISQHTDVELWLTLLSATWQEQCPIQQRCCRICFSVPDRLIRSDWSLPFWKSLTPSSKHQVLFIPSSNRKQGGSIRKLEHKINTKFPTHSGETSTQKL